MKTQAALVPMPTELPLRPKSLDAFWQEISEFTKCIERRAYELFEARGREIGHDLDDWFSAEKELLEPVSVEVTEKNGFVMVRAEAPGFKPEELEVNLEPELLIIKGVQAQETEREEAKTHITETRSRRIFRHIPLPVKVDPDATTANLTDGVLEIKAPRAAGPAEAVAA